MPNSPIPLTILALGDCARALLGHTEEGGLVVRRAEHVLDRANQVVRLGVDEGRMDGWRVWRGRRGSVGMERSVIDSLDCDHGDCS